ncbi:ATP-binding cassette domain-containing protein [Rhodopseudomonas palustris]|nr:ATP-binding cassette domain-containing protein [Rhodopseudomonas palustris]
MTVISLENYTQTFGARTLFRNVSARFEWPSNRSPGIIGLMGLSGSGKTSLLREIVNSRYGVATPALTVSPGDAVIGIVPQSPILFHNMDIISNSRMFGIMGRYRSRFDEHLFEQLKKVLRLNTLLSEKRTASKLSGGEMQRIMLLRTLSIRPDILLLDEPASGLDASVRDAFLIDLHEIVERLGVATLYVGHHWDEISFVSSKIAYLMAHVADGFGLTVSSISLLPRNQFENEPPTIDAFHAVYGPGCSIWPATQAGSEYQLVTSKEFSKPDLVACFPGSRIGPLRFLRRDAYRLALPEVTNSQLDSDRQNAWIYRHGSFVVRTHIDLTPIAEAVARGSTEAQYEQDKGYAQWN